ncbi:hypothetical protein BDC45DRAFT_499376 [Circinella umbellata]|nr:hypothetical protein BDC45DRAFT_499376 [Circinella umbellata]
MIVLLFFPVFFFIIRGIEAVVYSYGLPFSATIYSRRKKVGPIKKIIGQFEMKMDQPMKMGHQYRNVMRIGQILSSFSLLEFFHIA